MPNHFGTVTQKMFIMFRLYLFINIYLKLDQLLLAAYHRLPKFMSRPYILSKSNYNKVLYHLYSFIERDRELYGRFTL